MTIPNDITGKRRLGDRRGRRRRSCRSIKPTRAESSECIAVRAGLPPTGRRIRPGRAALRSHLTKGWNHRNQPVHRGPGARINFAGFSWELTAGRQELSLEVGLDFLNRLQPLALLILRFVLGAIMIAHGYKKVFGGFHHHMDMVGSLGLPHWMAYLSTGTEFLRRNRDRAGIVHPFLFARIRDRDGRSHLEGAL